MKVYGITGGVGCGKSTILELLKTKFNMYVIEADKVAHMLMSPDNISYEKIIGFFGQEIINEDKSINRQKLGNIVFIDEDKRLLLNSFVHPYVKKEIKKQISNISAQKEYNAIAVEAALLIEDHYEEICDNFWYVWADKGVRTKRLISSRGYSMEKVDEMINSQLSDEEFKLHCKYIIDNNESIESVVVQIHDILEKENSL